MMDRLLRFLYLLDWPGTWQDVRDAWANSAGDYVPFAGVALWCDRLWGNGP